MADAYRGSGLLPSVTDDAPRVYTPREVNRIARDQLAMEEAAKARSSGEVAMKAAAEESRRRRTAAAQARMQDPQAEALYQGQQADQEFGGVVGALSARAPTYRVENPAYPATRRYTDKMIGAPAQVQRDRKGRPVAGPDGRPVVIAPATEGLVDEVPELQRNADVAAIAREQIAAEAMGDAAEQHRQANERLYANQQAQARRQGEQLDRVRRANDLASAAADKFAESADVDPSRYWRNAPAWQKFTAALGAALLGWAGRTDPTAHITGAIANDIDAQKSAIAKRSQGVSDTRAQVGLEESLYHQILAQTGSEREADLIYTQALLQHAQSEMAARLQKAGVSVLNETQKLAFNGLQQELANITRQLELTAATNVPSRMVGGGPAIADKDVRHLLVKKGDAATARGAAMGASVIDTAQKREASAAKLAETQAASGPGSLDERKFRFQQKTELNKGEKAQTRAALIDGIRGYMSEFGPDIPGRSEWTIPILDEGIVNEFAKSSDPVRRETLMRQAIGAWGATVLTGANVAPEQKAIFDAMAAGEDLSGDQIRTGMRLLLEFAESEQRHAERSLEGDAAAERRGVSPDELPGMQPQYGGRQRRGSDADDAADLGGTLR